jgi:AraC-like DNA-binding protein
MADTPWIGIDHEAWARLTRVYRSRWRAGLYAVGPEGDLVFGKPPCRDSDCTACRKGRAFAVREALRWGEPTVELCPRRRLLWAVPLMHNETILGGLVASVSERDFFRSGAPSFDIRRACTELRDLVEAENLTNASALAFHRTRYQDEQRRAYAIHAYKSGGHDNVRELYLREEPALFSAIRSGDRAEAREILNRILVAIHHHAGRRLDLVKSLFLELVVSMARTAVEAGGAPEALLGANFAGMADLSRIKSDEELAPWLTATLEQIMDAIQAQHRRDSGQALFDVLDFMARRCGEKFSRDDAAKAAHFSPSHFSYLMRKEAGVTFTEMRNRMRVDRAAELLAGTDKPLALVALECGFEDQSYFTKVFRRYRGRTPARYRQELRAPAQT